MSENPAGQGNMIDGIESGFISLSDIANQILEDVTQLYGYSPERLMPRPVVPLSTQLQEQIDRAKAGELLLIATRSKELGVNFLIQSAILALEEARLLAIFSGGESFHRFVRRLVGVMANIRPEEAIYDGQLEVEEQIRMLATLAAIKSGKLYMSSNRLSHIEAMCDSYRLANKRCESGELVLVDHCNTILDSKHRTLEPLLSLIRLKRLAVELNVPVIAMYQLDSNVEVAPSILTKTELREFERLSEVADSMLLMDWTPPNIYFEVPKIMAYWQRMSESKLFREP